MKTFAQLRRGVRYIGVGGFDESKRLRANPHDKNHEDTCADDIAGLGTRDDPYRFVGAASVSPHYMIVFLWFHFNVGAKRRPTFIKANDWLFKLTWEGVVAENGTVTIIDK